MRWRYSRRAGPALKGEFRRAPAWVSRLSVQRQVLQFGFRSGYLWICLRCLLSSVLSKQVKITCVLFFLLFLVLAFFEFSPREFISSRSPRYCVKFCGALRGKFRNSDNRGLRGCHGSP